MSKKFHTSDIFFFFWSFYFFDFLIAKENYAFIQFDIKDFYPTNGEELPNNAISKAKNYITLNKEH